MRDAVAAIMAVVVALLLAGAGGAEDQGSGQTLDNARCAVCPQPLGEGADSPAGSEGADLDRFVGTVRERLPLFHGLSPGEIAAIVNYIRTAWDNDFDVTTAEEIAGVIDALGGEEAEEVIIWDGVFTSDQVARGEAAYITCSRCPGSDLNGAADDPHVKRNAPPGRLAAALRSSAASCRRGRSTRRCR